MAKLFPKLAIDAQSSPFMAIREGQTAGIPVRLHRITFSGELAYELWTPSWYGLALWEAVMRAGEPLGIMPYGTETMHVLRAEKGYIIGQRSHRRSDTARLDRKHLVGLLPVDGQTLLAKAQVIIERHDRTSFASYVANWLLDSANVTPVGSEAPSAG